MKSYYVPGTVLDTGISVMIETQPLLKELKVYLRRWVNTKLQHSVIHDNTDVFTGH